MSVAVDEEFFNKILDFYLKNKSVCVVDDKKGD